VVKEISRKELKAKMDRGDDFVLVEELSRLHFESSHLPGAINLRTSSSMRRRGCCPTSEPRSSSIA